MSDPARPDIAPTGPIRPGDGPGGFRHEGGKAPAMAPDAGAWGAGAVS